MQSVLSKHAAPGYGAVLLPIHTYLWYLTTGKAFIVLKTRNWDEACGTNDKQLVVRWSTTVYQNSLCSAGLFLTPRFDDFISLSEIANFQLI